MVTWDEFEAAAPELAAAGRKLLYQYGVGLGYLATIRADGGPRIHPICPILGPGGLHAFIVASPKQRDLLRDGRYALHAFAPEEVDDEFCVMGVARPTDDPARRAAVGALYHATVHEDDVLFELLVERCLLSTYGARGVWPPRYTAWVAPPGT